MTDSLRLPDGVLLINGISKFRCSCCESVKLVRVSVMIFPDGTIRATSPDGIVEVVK